jgi:Holliday junction resolvasome RuvABC ATP-dependent DNA helicase subunit
VEEILYLAMEGSAIDLMIGKGPGARSLRLELPPFTVIGTTSNPLKVNKELSDSMFELNFDDYDLDEISRIIISYAIQQQIDISLDAADLIAQYSNECPADSLKVLKKVYEYAVVHSDGHIASLIAKDAIDIFKIKANPSTTGRELIPTDVMMFVWQRDKGRCVKCGGQEKLEYDHIIPISKGGSNTERNIKLLCEHCNRSKGANIA